MKHYLLTDLEYEAVKAYLRKGTRNATQRKVRHIAREKLPIIVKDLILIILFLQKTTPELSLMKLVRAAQAELEAELEDD